MRIKKTIFVCLLGSLLVGTDGAAQLARLNASDQEMLSFCYGVYVESKNPTEVRKNNRFLKKDSDTYAKITNHPAYQDGLEKSPRMEAEEKRNCLLTVYGFLGTAQLMSGKKDSKKTPGLAYCLGYVNGAGEMPDLDFVSSVCNASGANTPDKKKACMDEVSRVITSNRQYHQGKNDATGQANALRVVNCAQKVSNATEQEIATAFTLKKDTLIKEIKSPEDDLITHPIFPVVKEKEFSF